MEKLEFGCKVKTDIKNYKNTTVLFHWFQTTDYTWRMFEYILCINWNKTKKISKWKVIWLPLQERFIRMYCKNKWLLTMYKNELQFNYANISIGLDDTKDFDNQSEKVYQKIYEALLELNK